MSKKFYIYLNLRSKNPKTFSVSQNGLVVDNIPELTTHGRFLVRKGGHAQAVREGVKNVHAFVVTDDYHEQTEKTPVINYNWVEVSYHHTLGDTFYAKTPKGRYPIREDYQFKICLKDHKCYIKRSELLEYIQTAEDVGTYEAYKYYFYDFDKILKLAVNDLTHMVMLYRSNKMDSFTYQWFDHTTGICDNLEALITNRYNFKNSHGDYLNDFQNDPLLRKFIPNFVNHIAKHHWAGGHYSGNTSYPIGESSRQAVDAFHGNRDKWEGSVNSQQRVHLLIAIEKYLKHY